MKKYLLVGLIPVVMLLAQTQLPPGTLISISNVINLTAELAGRPSKAGTFTASRAVYINSGGQLQSVAGTTTDCVKVDGSSGSCGSGGGGGSSAGTPVVGEEPSFISGQAYSLSQTPLSGTLLVYVNGQLVYPTEDYSLSTATITFTGSYTWLVSSGAEIRASYRY